MANFYPTKNIKNVPVRSKQSDSSFYGTILIPDMSGFTQFVNEIDPAIGRETIKELLHSIIESNVLGLKISEIEGDAILFYSKNVYTPYQIKYQYEEMLINFQRKVMQLSSRYNYNIKMSLKMIVHQGELSIYTINGFEKLYGKVVIEAHKLLKAPINTTSYLLITKNILESNGLNISNLAHYRISLDKISGTFNQIDYLYFNYQEILQNSTAQNHTNLLDE